ncbi:phthiodiolone/phenolphthiodiolone dimycocerosates ketoreductase [Sporichthya brevicatena]|uniref:Phthiodiolone/phenolphthiodiolone dimycocerosates ketoreductase n=1 Tax=Sporichthya brevicatena TaxID=171442 RepID=A0ABN1H8U0_9ACTN
MKLGLLLPTVHSIALNEMALRGAEALGVDDVWVLDHMMGLTHPALWSEFPAASALPDPDAFLDPFCVAAALGGGTDLRFGLSVTDAVRRAGPDLARAALTVNDACRGGFVLGLGSGEAESLVPYGYDYKRPVDRLEAALRDIRSLLDTGNMPSGSGRIGLDRSGPKGVPEVWVAAKMPRMLELTGRYADGWLPLPSPPEEYAAQYQAVREAAERAGRPAPTASMVPAVIFGDSRDSVLGVLEDVPVVKLIAYYLPAYVWDRYGVEHPGGPNCRGQIDLIPHELDPKALRETAKRIPVELVEELAWFGNADEIAARLKPYAEVGLEHIVLGDVTGTTYAPEETARVLGGQLPRLVELMHAL